MQTIEIYFLRLAGRRQLRGIRQHQEQQPMASTLAGRAALITGGLTGQGLAIAKALAADGASVAVGSYVGERSRIGDAAAYPDPTEVIAIRESLRANGAASYVGHLDVRDVAVIEHFVREATAACGPIDILVNAAGTSIEQPVCGHSDALWDKIIDTNLNGAFRMIRALLPGMIARRWGRVINIGSTAATIGMREYPAYSASKSGLLGLTRCVALEGAPHGVTCVMISPTWVETEMMRRTLEQVLEREGGVRSVAEAMQDLIEQNPQKRIIQPSEIAALATFLCRDEALGITMENIQVTGGAIW
jgi:3-hydroxybutyrate dehydrogenase